MFTKNKIYLSIFSLSVICIIAFFFVTKLKSDYDVQKSIEERPRQIISTLSLEEKVGQLFHIGFEGTKPSSHIRQLIQKYKVGGVILFKYNFGSKKEILELNKNLQNNSISKDGSGIPMLISTDQEGGRVKRLKGNIATEFPGAMALGQTGKGNYVREVAFVTAYELRALGINWVLAPVLDINNNPQNPVINVRSFGSHAKLVARMGKAYVMGNREALSLSAIKHFPGHGDTDTDSHFSLPRINKTIDELELLELLPFREAIKNANAEILMTAHILFPHIDPDKPATLSPNILKKILREKLNFQGVITTDAMEMKAIAKRYDVETAARLAFKAGADIILLTKEGEELKKMYNALLKDFRSKRLPLKSLDEAVKRQLKLKAKRGIIYRWKKALPHHPPGNTAFAKYWEHQEKKVQLRYKNIQNKYKKRGVNLNTVVSRASIVSLKRPFLGLPLKKFNKIRFLLKSEIMKNAALKMGIASSQISKLENPQNMLQAVNNHLAEDIWIIEITNKSLSFWNRLIKEQNKNPKQNDARTKETIALYTGNPFVKILIPEKGAVLSSFSKTPASQAALVYRILYPGRPIVQANLLLP